MSKVFDSIFPFIANRTDTQKINRKDPGNILDAIDNPDAISINTLKGLYSDEMHRKDKLEDKAKINLVGITIAISLILGASNFLTVISGKYHCSIFSWIVFILFIVAVLYLLIAGILAFEMLMNGNIIHTIDLRSFAADDAVLRQDYGKCISQNREKNCIRNNYVFTSYECIRNSLVCLFILLVFLVIPYSAI
jgi:hypothetical protein